MSNIYRAGRKLLRAAANLEDIANEEPNETSARLVLGILSTRDRAVKSKGYAFLDSYPNFADYIAEHGYELTQKKQALEIVDELRRSIVRRSY